MILTPKRSWANSLTVRLTPSSATDPFGAIKGASSIGTLHNKAHRFGLGSTLDDPRQSIDMAQNEVPAELVAEPQRSLDIDRRTHLPPPERCACQSLERRLNREFSGLDRHDREARSRAGDRRADRDGRDVKSCRYRQSEKIAAAQAPYPTQVGDDAGKHVG